MKRCTYCGKEYPDNATTCVLDDHALSSSQIKEEAVPGNWFDRQAAWFAKIGCWIFLLICQIPGVIIGSLFLTCASTPHGKDVGKKILKFSAIGIGIGILIRLILMGMRAGH